MEGEPFLAQGVHLKVRRFYRIGTLIVVPLALLVIACGGDDPEVGDEGGANDAARNEVEQSIRSAVDAYERQDVNTFLSFWTDTALEEQFNASREEIRAAGGDFLGGPPQTIRSFSDTEVRGDSARTRVEWAIAQSITREEFDLLRQDGTWRINSVEPLAVSIPDGVDKIDVDLDEFSFEFDVSEIQNGNIAFSADNIGEQAHELVLVSVPPDFTIQQLLQVTSGGMPEGVEFVGFTMLGSGEDGNLVFQEPLVPGKYMMVCFLPDEADPEQAPHAVKGMISEFSIVTQGGGGSR
jgi:hypothetical protein